MNLKGSKHSSQVGKLKKFASNVNVYSSQETIKLLLKCLIQCELCKNWPSSTDFQTPVDWTVHVMSCTNQRMTLSVPKQVLFWQGNNVNLITETLCPL